MGTREPKFVEPYQLTSSNFVTDFTKLLFDGYEPTFKTISLGQNFTTSSNVRFPQVADQVSFYWVLNPYLHFSHSLLLCQVEI